MKKLTNLFILMILGSSMLFAQINTSEQIKNKDRITNTDVDPNAKVNPHATTFTDDLFDHQFDFPCGYGQGEAGIETNGDYIYTSKWNGNKFFCYEIDGTFLGEFYITGVSEVRDMAYDGTYFYGAAANTALFEMDFVEQSGTLISTLTAPVDTRACAYDAEYDGFWGNNGSSDITLYDRAGSILNSFPCGAHSSYIGFARLNDAGNELLYGFAMSGGVNLCDLVQMDPETGVETGVVFDAIGYSSSGAGFAGGLASFDTYEPGRWTLLGIIQNETIFGVEGGIAGPPPDLDLKLTWIPEPNTGFELGVEDIVIKVKNQGAVTQTDFDVQYRVDGSAWVTETVPGPLAMGESMDYTFATAYDFSAFDTYYIEGEVILAGDEYPENNFGDKTIQNYDPLEWCYYSITLWDDYGDGWNGGYVQIFGDGVEYINATLDAGSGPETIEFLVQDSAFLTAVWISGGWPYECSYIIYDLNGDPIFEDGIGGVDPTGGDIGYTSCWIPDFDAGVTNIISPHSGMLLGIESVIIEVKNFGAQTLSEIPVGFNLDGAGWINEIIPGPIEPDEEIEYTFIDSVNLSEIGTYFIEVCTFVPDDEDPLNDCQDEEIENHECTYCDASTNTEDEYIANVLMGDIDNSSGWQGGVADYTDQFTIIEAVIPQEIVVTNGNAWAQDNVTVWVDWNEDCIFDNVPGSNEAFPLTHDGTGSVFTGDIIAPLEAIEGSHRMRIRMTYSVTPQPCCNSDYGEVEDYTVVVNEFVPPEITWYPTSFIQFVEYGGIAQDFLAIGNIGEGPLLWNIEVNTPWLIVDTLGSIVAPNDSIEVILNFNPGYLPAGSYFTDLILTSNDTINSEVIIPVEMQIEPPEPHFIFEGGDPSSSLWEIYICNAKLEDNDLVTHDEIAIFDGDLMVGVFTLTQVCSPENQMENNLTAFSELNTQAGYQAGNTFTFKCWDAREQLEVDFYYIELFNPYGDAYIGNVFPFEDNEYSITALDFFSFASQTIDLSLGFQFISSSVDPDKPDMLIVLDEILNDNLDFIRNSFGQTLRKIGPNWVNGIGDWIIEEGYLVKMNASDSLTIYGAQVVPISLIPVSTGFQFVSYFPETLLDALYAFETIIGDNLDFIRNSTGQMLRKIGSVWVNGIGECNPGEGYLVKMFADDIIIYPFPCGNPFADPRDEQIYNTVQIGDQCWMAENMNIGEMIIGTEEMANNGIIEKYCYDNNIANCNTYGGLYQWDEMMQYTTIPGVQGICPIGWSIPTDDEWKILEGTVDSLYPVGNPIWNNTGWRGFDAGLKLKSTSGWYPNFYRSDTCGFRALPGGYRNCSGYFYSIEGYGVFWSSTESISIEAWYRGLEFNMDKVSRYNATKEFGRSVRCLKNNSKLDNFSVRDKKEDYTFLSPKISNIEAIHFNFIGGNPADPVYTIYVEGLEIGNEIAAFDGETLIGAMKINSENEYENELPVFSTLNSGQGYTPGNPIILKAWDKSENWEYNLNDYTFSNPYGDAWTENVFPAKDGEYSLLHFSTTGISGENETTQTISIYPNPSEGIFNISIEGVSGKVQIKVFDVHGNDYRFFEIEGTKNMTTEQLDLKELAAGIYFISFSGKNFNRVKKIVIQ